GFYGMKDSRTPVKFSVISIILNIVLNYLLIDKMQYKGLALATSISSGVNFFCLIYCFNRYHIKLNFKKVIIFFSKTLIATLVSILASYQIENIIGKLLVFSIAYILCWFYSIYKKRMEVF
ncbi:MAG: lipid II flippase MurJ, partial [Fusobacteriaceae bacterium]